MDKSELIKILVLGLSKLPQWPKYPETGIIPPSDMSETSLDITCGAENFGFFSLYPCPWLEVLTGGTVSLRLPSWPK